MASLFLFKIPMPLSIQWFLSNKEQIPRMAKAARESVLDYTWDKYYEKAADSVERLVEKVRHDRER